MSLYAMEPMHPRLTPELQDRVADLIQDAAALIHPGIHASVVEEIADLVRSMNCYYSNLIEGHHTHPVEIDRALAQEFSSQPEQRDLQQEARAHIHVQGAIDRDEAPPCAQVSPFIRWVHREFCQLLPEALLWVENPDDGKRLPVEPGEFRRHDVVVGRHLPPPQQEIPGLLERFQEGYGAPGLSRIERIVALGAAHHRLLWIHPFLDGNGRVARLLSHAMLRQERLGQGLWSISRGLARQVETYKGLLQEADAPRRGDLDGRGNLSQASLDRFCRFFLDVCLDQVGFMRELLDLPTLARRIGETPGLPRGGVALLRHTLLEGPVVRGAVGGVVGLQERQARTLVGTLLQRGLLRSDGPRAPVRLGFPLDIQDGWFPRLYPPGLLDRRPGEEGSGGSERGVRRGG